MASEHTIDAKRIHTRWDSSLEPTLAIASGDTVHFPLRMSGAGQLELGQEVGEVQFDFESLYQLLGPVWIDGAEPRMTLEVEVISLAPGDWGWTVVLPELGLLPHDFPGALIRYFDLTTGDSTELAPGVEIPLEPFLGTIGTHPGAPEVAPPFPPHRGGGNIDTRHLTQGSRLFLPIWIPGAYFSCGDPHAAQGDGEVCVSAIECSMAASLRFTLHERSISAPRFIAPDRRPHPRDERGFYGTMGIASDLMAGAQTAVRGMIELLGDAHALSREDAYVLCSLAGDLKIFEIVDAGVWNVGMTMPRSVFTADHHLWP